MANRLPVDRVTAADGSTTWQTSPGGLVSALQPVMQQAGGAWVGWAGVAGQAPPAQDVSGMHLVPVPLSEAEVADFYEGFSNATLWPLYHDVIAPPLFRTTGRINGQHATLGQSAVQYLNHSYPREEMVALHLAADVMLVTPLRDGMNLVAKEYVACRVDEDGALVLSEFTGAADELGSAFQVNPHDVERLKEAIVRALEVSPREAGRRMRSMRSRVRTHDVHRWAASFLDRLAEQPG